MSATRTTSASGTDRTTVGPRRAGRLWIGLLAVAVIPLAGACESQEDGTPDEEPAEMSPAEEQEDTLPGEAPMTEQEQQNEQRRTAERATLGVATLDGGGEYVTDGSGRALYILEDGDDPSACADACLDEWPPFAASSAEAAQGGQLQDDLIDTVERPDGTMQVTYDGHPLYFYHDDQGPGDTGVQTVEDQWGTWYLLGPDGEPIEQQQPGGAPGGAR